MSVELAVTAFPILDAGPVFGKMGTCSRIES